MKDKYIVIKKSDADKLCVSMQSSLKHILDTIEFVRETEGKKPLKVKVHEE